MKICARELLIQFFLLLLFEIVLHGSVASGIETTISTESPTDDISALDPDYSPVNIIFALLVLVIVLVTMTIVAVHIRLSESRILPTFESENV